MSTGPRHRDDGSAPPGRDIPSWAVAVAAVVIVGAVAVVVARRPADAGDAVSVDATAGPAPDGDIAPAECSGDPIRLRGRQDQAYRMDDLEPGRVIDARGAIWPGVDPAGAPIPWTITLDGPGPGCWLGGVWRGAWVDTDPGVTWEEPYHHAGLVTLRLPDFTVAGISATNHGDGIRMDRGADDFRVVGVHLADMHDDCVENDYMRAGIVEDSLFDGCYVGFSAARHSGNDDSGDSGDGRRWQIRDNLVRLQPQPTTYSGPSPGHGQLFKWSAGAPTVDLVDNVFRVDQPPNHGSIGIPDEMVLGRCAGNVVVWGGDGPYPDPLPDCFRVTTDMAVWERAVDAWQRMHGAR